jgi:hypothetical protein
MGAPGLDFEMWETTNLNRHSYRKSYTDSVMGNWSYSYDNLNRLIGGSAASGPYSASPPSSWSYDPFGNRTSGVTPVSNVYASYTLPNNQITGGLVQYDAAGNVISDGGWPILGSFFDSRVGDHKPQLG